jgi:hypothetical protein
MGSAAVPTGRYFIAWIEGRGQDVNRLYDTEVRPVEKDVFWEMAEAGSAWARRFAAASGRRIDDVTRDICQQEERARDTRRAIHRLPYLEAHQELVYAFLAARATGDEDTAAALSPQVLGLSCGTRISFATRFAIAAFSRRETIPGTSRQELISELWPMLGSSEVRGSPNSAEGLWMHPDPVERLNADDEALLLAVFMRVLTEAADDEDLRYQVPPHFAVGTARDAEGTWLVIATGFGGEIGYGDWDGSMASAITEVVGAAETTADNLD